MLIPSIHLDGEVFTGGHLLFNWVLAARWDVPALIRVHWTVNPLIRIFTSPGLLLLPWLALIGGVVAWRRRGAARPLVVLAGSLFLLQYAVNTFVLVIPPDTRYYAVSYFLAAILAGMALSTLSAWLQLAVVGGLMLAPCLAVMALEPSFAARLAPLLPVMQRYQPLYLPQMAEQGAYLALQTGHFPDVHEGAALVGAYALLAPEEATACWKVMEAETTTPGPLWRLVETLRLDRVVPLVIARQLRRNGDATVVAQRTC